MADPEAGLGEHGPAFVAAVRLLSGRRLTRVQLRQKLRERGFAEQSVAAAVAECERCGYLDDRAYARLYVEGVLQKKPVGRYRLAQELFKRGVGSDVAREVLDELEAGEESRLDRALAKLEVRHPQDRPGQLGRRLERLGFAAPAISRALRRRSRRRDGLDEIFEEIR